MELRALIISGGPAHDYAEISRELVRILLPAGFSSEVSEDLGVLSSIAGGVDLLVLNCARWTCNQTPEWRDRWKYEIPEDEREGFARYLGDGGGLLALHAATICFDDWPEYRRILGAWWMWGKSGHSPFQEHAMTVRTGVHWVTQEISDFTTTDELYTDPVIVDSIDPLITAEWQGRDQPVLWTRGYYKGRVCYCALGHSMESFANPTLRKVLQRCALWAAGKAEREARGCG
jgi:type 1 glutamine amidotransferase